MPDGWGRHLDNDGNKYYVNPQGKSQWSVWAIPPPKPCPFSHSLIPEQIMQLAAGWEAHRDESGNVFSRHADWKRGGNDQQNKRSLFGFKEQRHHHHHHQQQQQQERNERGGGGEAELK